MDRPWKREELEAKSKSDLQNILKNKGQSTTGYKEQLIKRILGESRPKISRNINRSTEPKSTIINPEPIKPPKEKLNLERLPYDVELLYLYELDYDDIVRTCRASKTLNRACRDERFWENYANKHNIEKKDKNDTWKEAVKRIGMKSEFIVPVNGEILTGIYWNIIHYPSVRSIFEIRKGKNFRSLLTEEQLEKIVFENPVTLYTPHLESFIKEDKGFKLLKPYGRFLYWHKSVAMRDPKDLGHDYITGRVHIIPNTKYGSTLKHVLKSIYNVIWGLTGDEKRSLHELIENPPSHYYFDGISLVDKKVKLRYSLYE